MAKQIINLGTGELTGDGESIRSALDKVNDNFDEVYPRVEALEDGNITSDVVGSVFGDDSTLLVDGVNNKIVGAVDTASLTVSSINVALGSNAGTDVGGLAQGAGSIAIGYNAGNSSQNIESVAIGVNAGKTSQGEQSVAIGAYTAITSQGNSAVAIGDRAGVTSQGTNAVAIGRLAGETNQAANSIVINATGSAVENTTASSLRIKPIRSAGGTTMVMYNATSGEVTHTATPLITGDLAVEENFSSTPTNKYFEVETGSGNDRIMRSGINMSTFGQTVAPKIDLTSYRASPADGDAGPRLTFRASTAGSSNSVIANIETKVIATASGAETTKVSIRTDNAGTSVTPFTITGNTVYSASHISIADLKILVAAAVDFADYKNLIAAI